MALRASGVPPGSVPVRKSTGCLYLFFPIRLPARVISLRARTENMVGRGEPPYPGLWEGLIFSGFWDSGSVERNFSAIVKKALGAFPRTKSPPCCRLVTAGAGTRIRISLFGKSVIFNVLAAPHGCFFCGQKVKKGGREEWGSKPYHLDLSPMSICTQLGYNPSPPNHQESNFE